MRDLIIIGGSAAATGAGIYAARRKLDFFIITKEFGGEVATSGEIGNWPGTIQTNGIELAQAFRKHLDYYKVDIREGMEVISLEQRQGEFEQPVLVVKACKDGVCSSADKLKQIHSEEIEEFEAKAIIVATGVHPRKLGIPGEDKFYQKGLSYCTVCDGPLFSGKNVAVIGGGNSAIESALMLAEIAKQVTVINKNPEMRGEVTLIEKLKKASNVEFIYNADTAKILGEQMVSSLEYKDSTTSEIKNLSVEGIFVHIGMVPNTKFVEGFLELDNYKNVKINKLCHTNIAGVFAAGDVTDMPHHQIAIAAGQGVTALLEAVSYINQWK